ncbi:MAG TPA: ShlB/FhaC/HecB family hemolysin secretion/activation protein [Sphingobium sp.]|nr:ShlB/FhaC/HecB family hemolysin secretion/activation protein [Sphingobium sp.]
MKIRGRFFVVSALALSGVGAQAQQAVDPGRIDERFRAQSDAPSVSPLDVPDLPTQEAVAASALPVTLTAVRFDGATVVPMDALDALARPYLNRAMPLSDLFRLAEQVTAEYRRRGYALSRAIIAPQRIENGVATVHIVEGFIDQTRIEGKPGGYRPYLEAYLAPVRAERPTSGKDLARALLLARDLQGADVRAVLTPSADVEGAADLSLVVARKPVEAFVAVDNRGSRWLGPAQFYAGIVLNDLARAGGRLAITGVGAPDQGGELGFVSGTYDQPIGGSGLRASVFASYARTRPGDELRVLALEGESLTWGFGLQYPFLRSRETNILGQFSWTARDSNSRNILLDPVFDDKIRTANAGLMVNHADRLGGQVTVRGSITQGLGLLGATAGGDPAKSRATASGVFTKVNGEITRVQPIHRGLRLLLGATGQWTRNSLLASEEMGLGSTEYGRAYDPSEITGDKGFAGKAELFYTIPARGMGSVEPYVYYEGGRVYQNRPLPGEARRSSLRSVGAGLRVGIAGRFGLSMEYARPIGRDVGALGDRDGRIFLSFSAAY